MAKKTNYHDAVTGEFVTKKYAKENPDTTVKVSESLKSKLTPDEIGEKFEKEFASKSDYFNHRLGLFMEMKEWIIEQHRIN